MCGSQTLRGTALQNFPILEVFFPAAAGIAVEAWEVLVVSRSMARGMCGSGIFRRSLATASPRLLVLEHHWQRRWRSE